MRRLRLSKQCVMSEVKAFFLDQNRHRGKPVTPGRKKVSTLGHPKNSIRIVNKSRRNLGHRCNMCYDNNDNVVYTNNRTEMHGDGNGKKYVYQHEIRSYIHVIIISVTLTLIHIFRFICGSFLIIITCTTIIYDIALYKH